MAQVEHRKTIARNSVGFLIAGLIGHAYILATVPLLTRWLADAEWGFYTILIQINVIIQFAALTLFSQSLLKFYVEYEGREKARFIGTAGTTIVLLQFFLVACLYFARGWLLPTMYPNLTLPLDPVVGVAAAWFLAAPVRMFGYSILRIQERVREILYLNLGYGLCLLAAVFFFVMFKDGGLLGAIFATALAEWISLLALFLVVKGEFVITFVRSYFVRSITFAAPLLGGTLCVLLLNNLDRWVLSRHIDLAGMGVYGVGAMIGNTLGLVVTATMTSISPRMVKVMWREGNKAAASLASSIVTDVFVLVGVPFAMLCMFGELLVLLLAGSSSKWVAATPVIIGVAAGHFVRSLYLVSQNVLFYKGRTVLHLGTNIVLVSIAFIVGPALAASDPNRVSWLLAVTYALFAPVTFLIARRFLHFAPRLDELIFPATGVAVSIAVAIASESLDVGIGMPSWWISRAVATTILLGSCVSVFRRLFWKSSSVGVSDSDNQGATE